MTKLKNDKIMKRCLLLFSLAVAIVTSMYGYQIEELPYKQYFSDITFDYKTNKLTFTDTYKTDKTIDRLYIVEFYYREEGTGLVLSAIGGAFYTYGLSNDYFYRSTEIYDTETGDKIEQRFSAVHSSGGTRSLDISKGIAACLKAGEGRLFIAIKGMVVEGGKSTPYEWTENDLKRCGSHLNNHIEVDFTNFVEFTFDIPEKTVYYGTEYDLRIHLQAVDQTNFVLEVSQDGEKWGFAKSGYFTMREAREGNTKLLTYKLDFDNAPETLYYRVIVEDSKTHEKDTSEVKYVNFYYKWVSDGKITYHAPGTKLVYPKLEDDCMEYKVTKNLLGSCQTEEDGQVVFYQPACNAFLTVEPKKFVVRFRNSDYALLKEDVVLCGEDAVEPEQTPKMDKLQFIGWSSDITNVRKNMTVIAKYEMADFVFDAQMTAHQNEAYPFDGFSGSTDRVMHKDKLSFEVNVQAPTASTLSCQTGRWDIVKKDWVWQGNKTIGEYTAQDVISSRVNTYTHTIEAGIDNYFNEQLREARLGVRFVLSGNGATAYSEPFEFDMYYPAYISSKIADPDDPASIVPLQALNSDGDISRGTEFLMPLRYQDTLIVQMDDRTGGCLQFKRTIQEAKDLVTGLDKKGEAYLLGPGETEKIEVRTSRKVVWFDGTKEKHSYDFSDQSLGKYPNAWYAEIVNCGGSIKNMPETPVWEGRIFLGWKNETTDEYADDAYLKVPAIDGVSVQFTAQWEDPAEPELRTVNFYEKDGKTLIAFRQVPDGSDAEPPMAPEIIGWHFIGWSGSFKLVTEDRELVAMYGEDNVKWTVTYLDSDGTTVLGTEEVEDGYNAQGLEPVHKGKNFLGWDQSLRYVHSDITTKAKFEDILYTVTFLNWDLSVIDEQQLKYGEAAQDPGVPAYPGYDFAGWDVDFDYITSDLTVTAQFVLHEDVVTYAVTLIQPGHGTILQDKNDKETDLDNLPANTVIHLIVVPDDGYKFLQWSDGNKDNPRTIIVTDNMLLKVELEAVTALTGIDAGSHAPRKLLINGHLYILAPDGRIYDACGHATR